VSRGACKSDPAAGGESGIRGSGAHQVRGGAKGKTAKTPRHRQIRPAGALQPVPSRTAAVERRRARRVSSDAPPCL